MVKRLFIFAIFFSLLAPFVSALDTSSANNKFGIHLAVPSNEDIEKAAELVNANGGDWGYITLVIQENDRDKNKWQDVFEKLRELHLIPIIRLATKPEGGSWRRAEASDVDDWVDFLDSLKWVVKDRYIILFNEVNHGSEWGGNVDPVNYANVAKEFAQKLKDRNKDFFVMLAGMDASAPMATPAYGDEAWYLRTVIDTIGKDKYNEVIDGLSSHSYPNPGFVGSPYGSGRGTVRTYEWELGLLKGMGIKDLPVFITETGWEGNSMSRQTIASNFQIAYEQVWLPDDRVRAITPFVLSYQGPPFLGFSWKDYGDDGFHQEYYTVQAMAKKAGDPEIIEKGSLDYDFAKEFVVNSTYNDKVVIKNTGQAIWDEKYGYHLVLEGFEGGYFFSDLNNVHPDQSVEVDLFFKSGTKPAKKTARVALYKGDKKILEGNEWKFEILPIPKLDFRVSLYPRLKQKGDDFEIQVFDDKEQLVYKKKNVKVEKTKGSVAEVPNIVFGKKYRVVILKPYYLPRQVHLVFQRDNNSVVFERMWPFDFNKDGKFDLWDIWTLITHPSLISLLLPW